MTETEMRAVRTVLEFAEKWADGKRRDREAFEEAAPLVRALCVASPAAAPAGYAEAPDPERDRNRHNAMLVEAWREEFATLCKVLFPGDNGPIGWKHVQAKVKALADGGEGKT